MVANTLQTSFIHKAGSTEQRGLPLPRASGQRGAARDPPTQPPGPHSEGTPGVFRKHEGRSAAGGRRWGPAVCVALRSSEPENRCHRSQGVLGAAGLSKAQGRAGHLPLPAPRPFLLQDSTAAPASGPCPSLLPTGMSPGQQSDIQGPRMEAWGLVARPSQPCPPPPGGPHTANPAAPHAPWRQPLLFLPESGATSRQRPPPESSL